MTNLRQRVRLFAGYSRSLLLVLQFLIDFAVPDYSSIGGVDEEHIVSNLNTTTNQSIPFKWIQSEKDFEHFANDDGADHVVEFIFGGLFKDDESQIFGHVAERGYTYEVTLLQFPLYPLAVRTLAQSFVWLTKDVCSMISFASMVKVASIGLNFVAFILATDLLYSLSRRILQDEYLAYKTVLLFCLSPTTIMFAGGHVDAVLAAATFAAMLVMERSGLGFGSGLLLALCTSIHASGLLHLGLILHRSMKQVATTTILYVREKKKNSLKKVKPKQNDPNEIPSSNNGLLDIFTKMVLGVFVPGVWNLVLSLAPFVAFQWFAYAAFCRLQKSEVDLSDDILSYGHEHGLKMPGQDVKPSWCKSDPPLSYFNVQRMIWPDGGETSTKGLDILIYLTMNQLPYLISSAPALALIFWQSFLFLKVHRRFCLRLGLVDNTHLGMAKPRAAPVTRTRALPRECLIYLFHALTLAMAAIFSLPIQISNRLILCTSPVVYWIGAVVTTTNEEELIPSDGGEVDIDKSLKPEKVENLRNLHSNFFILEGPTDDLGNSTKIFFLGYCVVGTVLHVNTFPWT